MTTMLAAAVLVELFTSEGCSSCPPADAVLARLHREQPVPGVQLIVLSEHVDYWNNLGRRRPFSGGVLSDRQAGYGGRLYTPQAVIDGRTDVLGSDGSAIERAAKAAAKESHGALSVSRAGAAVRISVTGLSANRDARVMVGVVEDGLVSRVERGENAGRTLAHTAVVRTLLEVAKIPRGVSQWSGEVAAPTELSAKRTRLIAFVQDAATRRVLAAGALEEQRDGAAAERHPGRAEGQAHGGREAPSPE